MSNSDRLAGPDFLDSVADQSAAQAPPVNAAEFRQRATDWRADQARIEQLEADLARLERQLRSDTERARILDKLKTHLQAADEALAWPPPPTPPTRLAAETSNARGEWVLERLRGVLEHGKMGDKCLIAPDLVTAAIAALSAPKPRMVGCEGDDGLIRTHPEAETCDVCAPKPEPAEAQPVAKLVNRKDADGGKTTTFIRPTSLGMDLPLGEYPLHLHPPPSAPVGVEGESVRVGNLPTMNQDGYPGLGEWWVQLWRGDEIIARVYGDGPDEARSQAQDIADALNQQPAAVDEAQGEAIRARRQQIAGWLEGLGQAARSLRTIADQAGKAEGMEDMEGVRGYANSRATVAEAALAANDTLAAPPAAATR